MRLIGVEDKNTTTRRMWSMCGRVYRDKNFEEFLIINDDLGEFVTLLDEYGKTSYKKSSGKREKGERKDVKNQSREKGRS